MKIFKYIAVAFFLLVAGVTVFDVKEYLKEMDAEEEQKATAFRFLKENVTTIGSSSRYEIVRSMPELGTYYIIRGDDFLHSGRPVRLSITQVTGDFVENEAQWIDLGFSKVDSRMFIAPCSMATDNYKTLSRFSIPNAPKKKHDLCLLSSDLNREGKTPDYQVLPIELMNASFYSGLSLAGSIGPQKPGITLSKEKNEFSLIKWKRDESGTFHTETINSCCYELNNKLRYLHFEAPFNLIDGGFVLFHMATYPHDTGVNYRLFSYANGDFSNKMYIEARKVNKGFSDIKFIHWLDSCRMSVIYFAGRKSGNNIGVLNFCKPMPIDITL